MKKMQFVGLDDRNHCLVIDTIPDGGRENIGPSIEGLLLMGKLACDRCRWHSSKVKIELIRLAEATVRGKKQRLSLKIK
jgi:hypothetical protein